MSFEPPDRAWRADMLARIANGDQGEAADALLSLVNYDPERVWLEEILVGIVKDPDAGPLRSLAVTCLGHVARLHRAIDQQNVVPLLEQLTADPVLGGVAQEALDDVDVFVRRGNNA